MLVDAFELARRGLHKGLGVRPVIRSPLDILPLLSDIKDQQREHFLCLYLNAALVHELLSGRTRPILPGFHPSTSTL